MKKRLTAILLTLCLALSLAACSSGGSSKQPAQTQAPAATEEPSVEKDTGELSDAQKALAEAKAALEESKARAEAIPEDKLNHYGLTAEEFTALKTSIQEHIDSEWTSEEEYLNYDNGSSNDLWKVCTIIRDDASADFMTDEIIESYIDGASLDYGTSLWKERAIVLAHAVNDWAAQQNIDYDKYVHIWDALSDAFSGLMVADPYYLIPLFDLD